MSPGDERSVEAPRAKRQGGPRGSSVTLTGEWAPLPGRIVDIAATDDMLFLADVPETGHSMRSCAATGAIRAARRP